jgi:hypothetical protein
LDYSYNNKLELKITPQSVGVWGQSPLVQGAENSGSQFSLFETWVKLSLNSNWNTQIGRQVISLDDERMFGALDWAQGGRAHDAIAFNFAKNKSVPIYLMQETLDNLKDVFKYAFSNEPNLSSSPKVNCTIIDIEEFSIKDITITPIPLLHGNMRVNGYRIQNFAYCTDCNVISEDSIQKLQNLDILILDGLRYSKHPTHFSINESIEIAKKLNANKTFLTHISHDVSHQITENELPENIYLAYDGLELKL